MLRERSMPPIALTSAQMQQIQAATRPIPRLLRQTFIERIAALLADKDFSNADLLRAIAKAQRELLGPTVASVFREGPF
jgi:hypothetical protein